MNLKSCPNARLLSSAAWFHPKSGFFWDMTLRYWVISSPHSYRASRPLNLGALSLLYVGNKVPSDTASYRRVTQCSGPRAWKPRGSPSAVTFPSSCTNVLHCHQHSLTRGTSGRSRGTATAILCYSPSVINILPLHPPAPSFFFFSL